MPDYNYSQPGAYFITVCTRGRRPILSTIVGGDAYIAPSVKLTSVGELADRYLRTIPGIGPYVIMPNHVHMILHISSDNILKGPMWASAPTGNQVGQLVRSWKTLVTKAVGFPVWQRSFYDHVIRGEKDYIQIAAYIEENPARWCEDTYYSGE